MWKQGKMSEDTETTRTNFFLRIKNSFSLRLQILISSNSSNYFRDKRWNEGCRRLWMVPKGQLISKCPFGVIVWTKIPTIFFPGFLP